PGVRGIVCNQAKHRVMAVVKPEKRDKGINNPEDPEPCSGWCDTCHPGNEKDDARADVDTVVRRVDVKDAHQTSISLSRGGDKAENSNKQEDDTKKNRG